MDPLIRQVSRLFIWGFDGTRVTRDLRRSLNQFPPAGVILFRRNIESPRQLQSLTARLRVSTDEPPLVGIDQEGGRVARLPEPYTQYPPAASWGRLYERLGPKEGARLLRRIGRFMGRELASAGVNLNFSPVLDVNSNPKNPIIGDRAFSDDPKVVAAAALPLADGLKASGVIPCGKHFPGHGDTRADSHRVLPRVNRPLARLKKIEFPPFQAAIRKGMPLLMTAHVVYRALDPKTPATLSRPILENWLRRKMGFKGVVVSDDLEMQAIRRYHSLPAACLLALEAGVDLLLVSKGFEDRGEVVEKIAVVVDRNRFLKARLAASLARIARLKRRYLKTGS